VRRPLNAVRLEYFLTTVTADNHALTHSLWPSRNEFAPRDYSLPVTHPERSR